MRRTTFRITRSVKRQIPVEGQHYCSNCGALLRSVIQNGRSVVNPCLNCQGGRTGLRALAPLAILFLLLAAVPVRAFEMKINGKASTYEEGAAGQSVTFTVTGSGTVVPDRPPCTHSTFSYGYEQEGGVVHEASGTSLTLTARPGRLSVAWSRHKPGEECSGGGGAGGAFYAFAPPTLTGIVLDPPNVKILQTVWVSPRWTPCPANPKDPNTTDPCRGYLTFDPGDGRCSSGSYCTPGVLYYEELGTFTLRGRFVNPAGTSDKSITVNVGATQKPDAFYQILAPTPVAGSPVPFTNKTNHGFRSLFWDFGDGTTSTEENPVHTFPATDDYTVKLTATNEIGSDTFETTEIVLPKSGGTPPTAADFTWTPEKPVIGQMVTFTDKSKGTIKRQRWNFDDGSEPSYDKNPTHIFREWGQKNVELWVSNEYGRKGIVLFVQVLSNTSPPIADFDFEPFAVQVGQQVKFTDTSAGASGWKWEFGEDGATSTLQNPTYTYKTAGQKAVTLKVTNAFGTDSITKFFACHSNDNQLEAKFDWTPDKPQAGESVRFIDLSTGSPEKWSWVISDGTQSNERNLTHTFASPGEYGVSLRVDKGTQTHMLVQVLRVGETTGPVPDFTWTPGTPTPGQTVKFTNLSREATSYSWNFGDGSTSDAVDPEHKFTEEKRYKVTLKARNAAGQQAEISKNITVSTKTVAPEANFTAKPNPAAVNATVQFTDTSIGSPTSWSWDFGYSDNKSTAQHPTHAFPFEGTFQVQLTVRNSAGSSTVTLPVVIKNQLQKPVADFDWTPDPAVATQPVTFRDKSTNAPKGWSWTFSDGGTDSGSTATHTFATPGNYTVTLRASNEAGESELARTVSVGAPPLQAEFASSPAQPFAGKPVTFTDKSTGEPVSWKWIVDGHVVATTRNLTWTFFNGGEHTVGLEVKGAAGNDSFRQKGIVIQAPPVASFKAIGALVFGGTVTFVDTSSGNPTVRRWFVDDAFAGSGAKLPRSFRYIGSAKVRLEVENEAGKDGLTRFYHVGPNSAEAPRIKSVNPTFGPCFYSAFPFTNPIDVEVDWRKHQVGDVSLELNAVADPPVPAIENKALLSLDTRRLKYDRTINDLTFSAIGDGGSPSEPSVVKFLGFTVPPFFVDRVGRVISEDRRKSFLQGVYVPAKAYESDSIKFPKILGGGEFKVTKTQFKLEKIFRTDCSFTTYGEITGGIKIGKGFAGLKGNVTNNRVLTPMDKTLTDELIITLEGFGGFESKLKVDDAIPAMKPACENTIINEYICEAAEIKLEVQASLGGAVNLTIQPDGEIKYKDTDKLLKGQAFVTGTLKVGSAKFEAFGGGKAAFKLGNFSDPHLVKKADFTGEFGARLIWFGTLHEYKSGYGCTLQYGKDPVCGSNVNTARMATQSARSILLRPVPAVDRSTPVEQAVTQPPVVLQNVSSLADPASASRGEQAILVYLSEAESAGASLQRLDVKALRRNSPTGAWGEAQSISADANGDFNPATVLDSNNRAIVAWERFRNPALSYADVPTLEDMPKLLREVEIAVSMSDAGATTWLTPEMLTSNDLQDRQPELAALADGRTILVWIREPAGSVSDQQIVARILTGTTWSAEQIVATGMKGIGELAIAASGEEARLVVSHRRETGGNDLSFFSFASAGWSSRQELTNDAEDDRAPMVAFANAAPRVFWSRDKAIVTRLLSGGEIERVREHTDAAAVLNPAIAIRGDSTPVVVWSTGSDVRAVLRDARTNRWTTDFILTDTSRSHTALNAFFTPNGELHISTLGTVLELRDVESEIDGQPVLIEGVTFPGRSDLVAFQTPLRVDLAASSETFAIDPRQPIQGERTVVSIDLRNDGELPVRDVVVDALRGSSVAGSTTVAGDWMPGQTKRVEIPITYEAANKELVVVVDPAGLTSDAVPANNRATFSFANREPVACFQASAGSGSNPLNVTFDAGCSADLEGAIAHYAWSFGDGTGGSGSKVTHTFATAGTHMVLLSVTDAMGATSTRAITIDAGIAEDWRKPSAVHRLYLSVVGRVSGVNNTRFVSDLALVNTDLGAPLTVDAVYLPDGRSDAYRKQLELPPGALLQTSDIVAYLFGATNGTGSLRLDLSHPHAVAVARTYNDQPGGTAGFSNEALPAGTALRGGEKGVILQHWLPGYRTNVGFTEVDGTPAELTVTAFNEAGVSQGQTQFAVGPYGHIQVNGVALFQGRGRIEVEVRGGAVLAYASTIDGKTGDPIYQVAERIPAAGPRSLLIPIVGRLAGVNDSLWRSDVRVMNADAAAQMVTLALRTGGGTLTTSRSLAPGETLAYDDVITNAFPQLTGNVGGSLLVSAPGPIIATSRTFNIAAGGTYGLYVPARSAEELTTSGESAWLVQLQENDLYRCNLGVTSYDNPVTVSVRAFDASGTTLAVKQYGVGAGQNVQFGRFLADMGVTLPLAAAGAEVTVLEGTAFIYASIIDNRTVDTTFVEGRR